MHKQENLKVFEKGIKEIYNPHLLDFFFFFKANYKIQACQLQKDIADLKRRVNNAKFRLDSEKKVRNSEKSIIRWP